ncbi:MAG: cytochrome c oxidase subunit 3 [Mycobacterium sp.]|uniref:cytochrome c oxidase subunit 3 n=1 Tax=Mycobacterium sp. TaxID=1785 RepID=UPI003C4DB49B
MWIVLLGDMTVFAVLFALYLNRRGHSKEVFATSQDHLNRTLGVVNTLVLLSSSLLVVLATRALRDERLQKRASPLVVAAIGVGMCFVVVKVIEYREKVSVGITPTTNEFYMYYFIITGLHLMHVIIGLIILVVLSRLAKKSETSHMRIAFFEGGACFWHMVDLLWLVIFPLVFLVR